MIEDHDTALLYSTYLGLTLDAIPPNFYAYLAGRYGMYIGLEVLLIILLSFFTAGAGGAAKGAALGVRMLSGFKNAKAAKKLNHADHAIGSLMKTVDGFIDSAKIMKKIGQLLPKRLENIAAKVATNQTTTLKKKSEKRIERCRVCNKDGHSTPAVMRLGEVNYI